MLELREKAALQTPTDLSKTGADEIANELRQLLADVFVLYVKTKNFRWHVIGRRFRDYHLLLDEQAQQILAMTDDIAEQARKISGTNIRSTGDISRNQRLHDIYDDFVVPHDILADLSADNERLTRSLRSTHETCVRGNDVAIARLIKNCIDETERRTWFLFETSRCL